MSVFDILVIAISLSLDAVVVAVGAGALNRMTLKRSLIIASVFGVFQAIMPLGGWLIGYLVRGPLLTYGRWVGFALILLVGLKMLKESFSREDVEDEKDILHTRTLLVLAVATSIDAFAVGITFSFIPVSLFFATVVIGFITLVLSLLGIYIGMRGRHLIGTRIEIVGAVALILLAFKTLLT